MLLDDDEEEIELDEEGSYLSLELSGPKPSIELVEISEEDELEELDEL